MATTSIWRVGGWLGKVVIYVENPDKTENPAVYEKTDMEGRDAQGLSDVIEYAVQQQKTEKVAADDEGTAIMQRFVSGVNCSPSTARDEMIAVKKRFGKEDGTVAYHGYQSFAPGEADPQTAHEIGLKLAKKLWGEKYQVVVATHLDRPVILTELKTKAAERNIPLPDCLAECLKEAKKKSTSDYVVANRDGEPLSYTQFKRLWQYIVTRTAKPRKARKLVDGKYVNYMLYPKLGEKARNNGHVVYSLDFDVTLHMLRHTYITNLIHSSVDPKTVQYLAGHESSRITMDIYAKVKYNKPDQLAGVLNSAFAQWDAHENGVAQ